VPRHLRCSLCLREDDNVSVLLSLLMVLATTTPPAARVVEKVPVFVQSNAVDAVGASYVSKLRETLERSSAYRPVSKATDAKFLISVVTMDPNDAELDSSPGHSTVAAVTLQQENANGLNYHVYSWVLIATQSKVDSLAIDLFAAIDKEIQDLNNTVVILVR